MVYFVQHNGGSVWFDELGQPWPKHPCFDAEPGSTRAAIQIAMRSPLFEVVNRARIENTTLRSLIPRDHLAHIALDAQGRRRCQFCKARVKPKNYANRLSKEHGMGAIADVIRRHCKER